MQPLQVILLCSTLMGNGFAQYVDYTEENADGDEINLVEGMDLVPERFLRSTNHQLWKAQMALDDWKRNVQQRITPNSFSFPLVGKRTHFNPNTFLFPMGSGKRTVVVNVPRPNGFLFPHGKRSQEAAEDYMDNGKEQQHHPEQEEEGFVVSERAEPNKEIIHKANMIRPNGFVFTMKGKRSTDDEAPPVDEKYPFFAGRGRRQDPSFDSFMAGRGKRENPRDNFFAGRGKKSPMNKLTTED